MPGWVQSRSVTTLAYISYLPGNLPAMNPTQIKPQHPTGLNTELYIICRNEDILACLEQATPASKATSSQGAWLDVLFQAMKLVTAQWKEIPNAAAAIDDFLTSPAKASYTGSQNHLLQVLYTAAISPVPLDFGPLSSKAAVAVRQIIILVSKRAPQMTANQLFNGRGLAVIDAMCDQLVRDGSNARALVGIPQPQLCLLCCLARSMPICSSPEGLLLLSHVLPAS